MKKKLLFTLAAALTLTALSACNDKPTPTPPGPGPEPASEITSNNVAPAGFVDDGPASWDE